MAAQTKPVSRAVDLFRPQFATREKQDMKPIRLVIILFLISLFLTSMVWAFQPGPDIIRECPKCKTQFLQATTMSGNTVGARFWTDGKMLAPMLPDRPWLVKCSKCGNLIWVDEAEELGERSVWDENKKWPDAAHPSLPSETEILNLLASAKLSNNKELYARRISWWSANDTVRMNAGSKADLSSAQKENMQALANLLDEQEPDQRIMKAEIYRELGKFKDCIKLLEIPFKEDHYTEISTFILKLAEKNISIVREIKED